jgi:hypothetical protein
MFVEDYSPLWLKIGWSANGNYKPFSLNTLTAPKAVASEFLSTQVAAEQNDCC